MLQTFDPRNDRLDYRADEAFCTGTRGELAAVTTIDGCTVGDGRPGVMTRRLTALFRELTAREDEPVG
jgi:branched-chain amino acid aminotransferase